VTSSGSGWCLTPRPWVDSFFDFLMVTDELLNLWTLVCYVVVRIKNMRAYCLWNIFVCKMVTVVLTPRERDMRAYHEVPGLNRWWNICLPLLLVIVVTFKVVSPLLSFCNGSGISVTAGSDILELRVTIVSEFQRHPRNNTLLAAISLSETRNYKGPNQASKDGAWPQPKIAALILCAITLSWWMN
jgi:hypothetical protein